MNFTGLVISDWEDVKRLFSRDRVANSGEEAVRLAVMAGIDMSMVPFDYTFYERCLKFAESDAAFAARVEDANRRIMRVKDRLGLFEDPFPHEEDLKVFESDEGHALNLVAARESVILAQNADNTLPITKDKKVLVAGPTGNLLKVLNGGWSYSWRGGNESFYREFGRAKKTVFEAVQAKLTDESNATWFQGVDLDDNFVDLDEAVQAADDVDYIIMCIGEDTYIETSGNIDSLMLPDAQFQFADRLFETKKPVIVVYLGGRPRVMTSIAQRAQAVLVAFLPGLFSF
jgi:beta-glucosidase